MTNGKIQKAKCGFIELLAAAIILAAAVLCGFVRPAAASAETLKVNTETVLFYADTAAAEAGESADIDLCIEGEDYLAHALAVTVWYDAEALELNSVTRGSAIDWENTLNHLDTSMPGRISLGVLYPGNEGMTQANNGIIHTMNFTVLAGAAEDSEIRVEVKKFNYMMTDDDQYPVPTQTQSGWIFVDGGEPGVPGDADGDGVVTAADALLVMRCALGTAELSPETAALCDADGDGNVTLSDAVLILRAALGLG